MDIRLKRAYDDAAQNDGYRILVDRIWPRGVSKEDAKLDEWNKDISPSTELRKWFGHDESKWDEFQKKYIQELHDSDKAMDVLDTLRTRGKDSRLCLVYAAKNTECNNAVVLKHLLQDKEYTP